ncbi:F0F1 ATP synthase subunit C [Helicobacter kayseriensis]|uniref:F0F1 ATP synthase subunit C n=1 Tax=Helicobacter kayseriensis TaxID=2905877 RepID=UPI001E322345|nr:F0F1 ATP synthase subunit C [Helicobacter kayseriensis]MCE3047371.1 F0F1 ATP synthase subunit C [Helicobacter kayseriensis]MCE3048742.1 F0F1 ATP synthase subunit C [Helicobacter kayseriensis]
MKKVFFLMFVCLGVAFASDEAMIKAYSVLGAIVGLGIAAFGGALGMGYTASATISGIARNPSVGGKLTGTMFLALALIEAQVIYTLVLAIIAFYANPFI